MHCPQPVPPIITSALFKDSPTDFIVTEHMHVTPSGTGEHHWLYLKKINLNTQQVAKLLAMWAGIAPKDVGFSGLKDKRSVSFQWFSLRLPKGDLPDIPFDDFAKTHLMVDQALTVCQVCRHHKKLNRGTHRRNGFVITLRQVQTAQGVDRAAIDDRLRQIQRLGVANYFGQQRFGHNQSNITQAERLFKRLSATAAPYRPAKKDKNKHALYISAARSLLFNELLADRIRSHHYDTPMAGDVFNLDGTGSIFCADDHSTDSRSDDEIAKRLARQDIHIAGLLYGQGTRKSSAVVRSLEDTVLMRYPQLCAGLDKVGVTAAYRPLRLKVDTLDWQWTDEHTLKISFDLTKGSFATSVLSALVDTLIEPATRSPAQHETH